MFYISTNSGVDQWDENKGRRLSIGPEGESVRQVIAGNGYVSAIGKEAGVWQKGKEWKAGQVADGVSAESLLGIEDLLYVGTEPARVFRKRFGGGQWELIAALDELPLAEDFHTPWGGPASVRTMAAISPKQFYLDIHVGGIVRTRDGGRTWEAVNNGLEEDVHQVATHPSKPERVYAATADGFYLSEDEGATWQRRNEGMTNLYCRGIAVHPTNPDIILLSGSPSPPPSWRRGGPQFALFRTEDAGRTWRRVIDGLPCPCPSVIDTNNIAFSHADPDLVLCALRSGELFMSRDAGTKWEKAAELGEIYSVCYGRPQQTRPS